MKMNNFSFPKHKLKTDANKKISVPIDRDKVILQVTDAEENQVTESSKLSSSSSSSSMNEESAWNAFLKKRLDATDPKTVNRIWMKQKKGLGKQRKIGVRLNLTDPLIPARMTKASFLRKRNAELEKVKKHNMEAQIARPIEVGREVPEYKPICPKQNLTSQFRYKYARNNPVVSNYYIEHYEKHEKPPFIMTVIPPYKK